MKLLLTSMGLTNDSLTAAFVGLLGRPVGECSAVAVSTALYASPSGPSDAFEMSRYYAGMGFREVGLLELTALPSIDEAHWLPTLEAADAVVVSGGNTGYLSHWFERSGFAPHLRRALDRGAVYVGISAGSAMLCSSLNVDREVLERTGVYYDDEYDEAAPLGAGSDVSLGLMDLALRPHLGSDDFPNTDLATMERWAGKVDGPLYAIDDQSAIRVVDGVVDVVSEGTWKLFGGAEPTGGAA